MSNAADRKLYLGPRLRVLRRELGLNQTQMAEELGVSASYLNHLERNQRPLTAQMLLRLASTYDIDMRDFVARANEAAASTLHEVFADPLVQDIGIPRHEVMEVAENYPSVAEAVLRLYRALSDLRRMPERMERLSDGVARTASPLDWLREWLEQRHNHFAELDQMAETLSLTLGKDAGLLRDGLTARLAQAHRISVRIVPTDLLPGALRHYDYHRRRLMLSEHLPVESRLFALAHQLVLMEMSETIATLLARAAPPDAESEALARMNLLNYAAAALVMPYARFYETAERCRYDLDLLSQRFGVSLEQAAHRLTTLSRQGTRGVPFFLLKIDVAGNVSKRFAGETLPLARFGGGCPRWPVYRAARLPGETIAGFAEAPDGSRYFSLARAIFHTGARSPGSGSGGRGLATIILGCEAKHAPRIAATDGLDIARATAIGPACHICERQSCPERALPPVTRVLQLHQYQRSLFPYPFQAT